MRILFSIVFAITLLSGFSQETKKFDRERWEELKGNIKYKKTPSPDTEMRDSKGGGSYGSDSDQYGEGRNSSRSGRSSQRRKNSSSSSSEVSGMSGFANALLIIIAVVLVAFLIYFFLFKNKSNEAIKNIPIEDELEELDIHTIQKSDLELALEKALNEKDYRKCIRIYFTFILKELSSNGMIHWEKEKTNYDYLRELKDLKEFHGFRNAVELFEIIWYGKRNIGEEIYRQIEPDLKNYLKEISHT
ncbi:MAG: hypothetical protein KDC84_14550 [Crocinitomicaceae bacterium]|nr:hypothetical protein [Crocinitomicaceae bacterium]